MLRGHLLDDVRLELWHLGNLQHLLGAVLGVNGLKKNNKQEISKIILSVCRGRRV